MKTPTTVQELLDYWSENIPCKGSLVSSDGYYMCFEEQVLHFLGQKGFDELCNISQGDADRQVAEIFGISLGHSILLRIVNDELDGAPSNVIRNPKLVLGSQAHIVLAFWSHLDGLTRAEWEGVAARAAAEKAVAPWSAAKIAPWSVAGEAAWEAAYEVVWKAVTIGAGEATWKAAKKAAWESAEEATWGAAKKAPWESAEEAAWKAAWRAAGATHEIQGASVMRARNLPFYFLPLFGFADPEAVMAVMAADEK
jgi:hypothetical protein